MKVTKDQEKIIKAYAKENEITTEQALNYAITILQQELEN